ncbi:hypothetical protein [Bordetella flabilis]|uniref:Uncharacterized protein n=1 Tax=Bordetella flabilis TaxID=463014 RepID=A0A193GHG0_9BORD|nr:hypothetical protein [Bordetella flabilis]ANN78871.1 hypothetical protein BAU07_18660 [Bordetella flabilis]
MDQQKDRNGPRQDGMSAPDIEKQERAMPASSSPSKEGPLRHRATRMDGNPGPVPSDDSPTGLKPRDDTPGILERKEGPKP